MKSLALVLICCINSLYAQDMRDHWILGDSMHLKFTDSGLVYFETVPFWSSESLSSISDSLGSLLFYGGDAKIMNRNNVTMDGCDSLFETGGYTGTVTQGALILPLNYINNTYIYVFLSRAGLPATSLSTNIVDMNLQSSLGGAASEHRRVKSIEYLCGEQLQAVKHGNGMDWWVITRKLIAPSIGVSRDFVALLYKEGELIDSVISSVGIQSGYVGEMSISPSGSKMALASYNTGVVQLFDFDRCSGLISNPKTLINDSTSYYGCAFSPDESKLYVSKFANEVLFQLDISTEPVTTTEIFNGNYGVDNIAGQLELGPDGKIYWIQKVQGSGFDPLPAMYLGVIDNPDAPGLSCLYKPHGAWLGGRANRSLGLPNHPNYYLGPLVGSPCDTLSDPDTTSAIQPINVALAEPCFELRTTSGSGSLALNIEPSFLNSSIELYNSSGAQVYAGQVNTTNSMLSTTNWTPGVYVARLRTPNRSCPAQKFLVAP
ncbi:MAG: T9SS type A sorting domain-containing protein [Bacteroidetes bacterium]|nr:T9SS type A sorting domain-containing protein [Bacteroidota bacterium]